jgi:hypothetical protein
MRTSKSGAELSNSIDIEGVVGRERQVRPMARLSGNEDASIGDALPDGAYLPVYFLVEVERKKTVECTCSTEMSPVQPSIS